MSIQLIEQPTLDIGIVALTDCAPLVMAKKLGYFEAQGLQVNLHIQPSWATVRDRLHAGLLDAAQVLAPMPLASTLGLNGNKCELINVINLSMNGNGITLSNNLIEQLTELNQGVMPNLPLDAQLIAQLIKQSSNDRKLKFAAVYPYSCHYYQLRDWLQSGGIDPDSDIETLIIPPTQMANALANGDIDGFCVGTPWNAKAVRAGTGTTVTTSCDIWQQAPEKALAVSKQWQQQNPNTFAALLTATKQACQWLQSTANRFEAAVTLQDYLNEPLEVIAPSLIGSCLTTNGKSPRSIPDYNCFSDDIDNIPQSYQGANLLEKMASAGQLPKDFQHSDWSNLLAKVYPAG